MREIKSACYLRAWRTARAQPRRLPPHGKTALASPGILSHHHEQRSPEPLSTWLPGLSGVTQPGHVSGPTLGGCPPPSNPNCQWPDDGTPPEKPGTHCALQRQGCQLFMKNLIFVSRARAGVRRRGEGCLAGGLQERLWEQSGRAPSWRPVGSVRGLQLAPALGQA